MGNIEHRRINKLFPSSNNLDNPSTKSQQNNHENSSEYLNNQFNPKKQSLLQLTLSDNAEIQLIMSNISLYCKQSHSSLNGGYPSISSLKEYYKVKKQGYCTQQQIFYLIFQGCSCCGLKDQFGVRKMMSKKFNDKEIISILKTYIAGIYIYIKQYKRNIQKIDLDDIGFQIFNPNPTNYNEDNLPINQPQSKRKIRIFFIEPWVKQKKQQQTINVNQVNILLQNPSPQRLKQNSTKLTETFLDKQTKRKSQYQKHSHSSRQFFSLLFSIGVIGLKLLQMGFVDDIYTRSPSKKVNFERIQGYLQKLQTNNKNVNRNHMNGMSYEYSVSRKKIIAGLRILLLSGLPEERQKIFQFWGIKFDEINYLDQINLQYSDHFQNGRQEPRTMQVNKRLHNVQLSMNPQMNQFVNPNPVINNFSGKFYDVENPNRIEYNKIQRPPNNFMVPSNMVQNQRLEQNSHSNSLNKKQMNSLNTRQMNLSRNYVYKLNQIKAPMQQMSTDGFRQNVKNEVNLLRDHYQLGGIQRNERVEHYQNFPTNRMQQNNIEAPRQLGLNQFQMGYKQKSLGHPVNNIRQDINKNSVYSPSKIQSQQTQLPQKLTQDSSIIYLKQ